jgi:excisionase family DNA binding protein
MRTVVTSAETAKPKDGARGCDREVLWPPELVKKVGVDTLQSLYGDIPGRTRLHIDEVARRLRCSDRHVRNLLQSGDLGGSNVGVKGARAQWRIYRESLIRWLFEREFEKDISRRMP